MNWLGGNQRGPQHANPGQFYNNPRPEDTSEVSSTEGRQGHPENHQPGQSPLMEAAKAAFSRETFEHVRLHLKWVMQLDKKEGPPEVERSQDVTTTATSSGINVSPDTTTANSGTSHNNVDFSIEIASGPDQVYHLNSSTTLSSSPSSN